VKPKIFVTHTIPDKGIIMLKEKFDIELNDSDGILEKKKLIDKAKNKDVILSLLSDSIDSEVINSCNNLKIISNYAVGFNNIDLKAATERGIFVTNTPRTLDETTADFVFALILSISRRVVESDKFMRSGQFNGWGAMDFLGFDVYNSTLGVIGMGNIGKAVGRIAYYGFLMKVLYSDKFIDAKQLKFVAENVGMDTLLSESDFVTINVPLKEDTFHLIGERELNLMKKTSYLINTSRGPVVDEKALYNVLKEKRIAGAAIDVYENEPKFVTGLEKLDNIIMTPHIASATIQTRQLMSFKAAQNILDFFNRKIPEGLVNKDVLKTHHF
jgi:glyoxylate reductase